MDPTLVANVSSIASKSADSVVKPQKEAKDDDNTVDDQLKERINYFYLFASDANHFIFKCIPPPCFSTSTCCQAIQSSPLGCPLQIFFLKSSTMWRTRWPNYLWIYQTTELRDESSKSGGAPGDRSNNIYSRPVFRYYLWILPWIHHKG